MLGHRLEEFVNRMNRSQDFKARNLLYGFCPTAMLRGCKHTNTSSQAVMRDGRQGVLTLPFSKSTRKTKVTAKDDLQRD